MFSFKLYFQFSFILYASLHLLRSGLTETPSDEPLPTSHCLYVTFILNAHLDGIIRIANAADNIKVFLPSVVVRWSLQDYRELWHSTWFDISTLNKWVEQFWMEMSRATTVFLWFCLNFLFYYILFNLLCQNPHSFFFAIIQIGLSVSESTVEVFVSSAKGICGCGHMYKTVKVYIMESRSENQSILSCQNRIDMREQKPHTYWTTFPHIMCINFYNLFR